MNNKKTFITTLLAAFVIAGNGYSTLNALEMPKSSALNEKSIERIGGKDRYETSMMIAKKLNSKKAYIVNGVSFADVLSIAPVASHEKSPIILATDSEDMNKKLTSLGIENITIVGGERSVSQNLENELSKKFNVNRISGRDRYETSEKIVRSHGEKNIAIASGKNFPDALSASPLMAKKNMPLLLVKGDKISEIPSDLNAKYTIGGENTIKYSVGKRISGKDRYETSEKIAKELSSGKHSSVILSSGKIFSDSLSVSPFAHSISSPIVLTDGVKLSREAVDMVKSSKKIFLIGGENTISKELEKSLLTDRKSGSTIYVSSSKNSSKSNSSSENKPSKNNDESSGGNTTPNTGENTDAQSTPKKFDLSKLKSISLKNAQDDSIVESLDYLPGERPEPIIDRDSLYLELEDSQGLKKKVVHYENSVDGETFTFDGEEASNENLIDFSFDKHDEDGNASGEEENITTKLIITVGTVRKEIPVNLILDSDDSDDTNDSEDDNREFDKSAIRSISVLTSPSKTEYKSGDYFIPTGMALKLVDQNGTEKQIDFSDSSFEILNEYSIDVDKKETKLSASDSSVVFSLSGNSDVNTSLSITVDEKPTGSELSLFSLDRVEIVRKPDKMSYRENETINTYGMIIRVFDEDGNYEEFNSKEFEDFTIEFSPKYLNRGINSVKMTTNINGFNLDSVILDGISVN